MSRWADNYDGPHAGVFYVVIPIAEATNEMLSAAIETSWGNLRTSLDGSKVILKAKCTDDPGGDPSVFAGRNKMNHPHIIQLLSGVEWTEPGVP